MSVKLNDALDRAEWLQCLQAAATIAASETKPSMATALEVAEIADGLYAEYRKRADG